VTWELGGEAGFEKKRTDKVERIEGFGGFKIALEEDFGRLG